jgi:hypothetical protein
LNTTDSSYNETVDSYDKGNHAILTGCIITDWHQIQYECQITWNKNNKVAFIKCLDTREIFGGATLQTLHVPLFYYPVEVRILISGGIKKES